MTAPDKQIVDTALLPLLDVFPTMDISADTLLEFRGIVKEMSPMPDASAHTDVSIEEVLVPGGGSLPIRCLLYRPRAGTPKGALLHIHGGGFVMGMPEMNALGNIDLVRNTGCVVLSPDYRLAPEHPHPAALEDCHTALLWLYEHVPAWGITASRIGVIGESAGGGLAASLALLARDRGSVTLGCQVLIYPMLAPPEHSLDWAAPDGRTGHFVWTRASDRFAWSAYLGGNQPDSQTIAGIAADLARLPPTFLAVGELDLFVHDNLAHVRRMLSAGCSVEAHLYPGAFHAFDLMADAPVSQRYRSELLAFIVKHLG